MKLSPFDVIVINSSAGKDSAAMSDYIMSEVIYQDYPLDQVVMVHADLGKVEWEGAAELAEEHANFYGLRFMKIARPQGDLLEQIEQRRIDVRARALRFEMADAGINGGMDNLTKEDRKRLEKFAKSHPDEEHPLRVLAEADRTNPIWPSSQARYCTSDQKRGQIQKLITELSREISARKGEGTVKVLNCLGLRAAESPARKKKIPFEFNRVASTATRRVWTWLSIHDWTDEQVWSRIRRAGLPHHFAYDLGMPRLSCAFCVFAPKSALVLAGKHNRVLLDEYVELEERIGYSFRKDLSIKDVRAAVEADEAIGPMTGEWNM